MTTIVRIGKYTIRPEALDACRNFIHETIAYAQANEPETLLYMVLQDNADPASFVHIQAYSSQAALEHHLTAEPMATNIREVLVPAIVDGPHFTHYSIVDAKLPVSEVQTAGHKEHSL